MKISSIVLITSEFSPYQKTGIHNSDANAMLWLFKVDFRLEGLLPHPERCQPCLHWECSHRPPGLEEISP